MFSHNFAYDYLLQQGETKRLLNRSQILVDEGNVKFEKVSLSSDEKQNWLRNITSLPHWLSFKSRESADRLIAAEMIKMNREDLLKLLSYSDEIPWIAHKNFEDLKCHYYIPQISVFKESLYRLQIKNSTSTEIPLSFSQSNTQALNIQDLKHETPKNLFKQSFKRLEKEWDKGLEKIVLSKTFEMPLVNSPESLIEDWMSHDHTTHFQVLLAQDNKYFLANTPERVLKKYQKNLEIEALAGTSFPGTAHNLEHEKTKKEHDFVHQWMTEKLQEFSLDYEFSSEVLDYFGLEHLKHSFCFQDLNLTKSLHLLEKLHPSPAILGTPDENAAYILKEIEEERALYGSLMCMGQGQNFDSCALLRGLFIDQEKAYIRIGVGVTKDSLQENESKEAWSKLRASLSPLLSRPEKGPQEVQ